MAGKRKVYARTDINIPKVEHRVEPGGKVIIPREVMPPANTVVALGYNPSTRRTFHFAPFYGAGIDEITYACQRQIERFLANQDFEVEVTTVVAYCRGLKHFLEFLILRAAALRRSLTLGDIDRDVIAGFLGHLADAGLQRSGQRNPYTYVKSVLQALGRRGLIRITHAGDDQTFPGNPFPNSNRRQQGVKPLSRSERQAFTAAVKNEVMALFNDDVVVTRELMVYALLVVALHTGRNTTPLLEMVPDCLRSHPKENTSFLVLWKRRGHNSSKVALRADKSTCPAIESTGTVKLPVIRLIRRVIELTESFRAEAPEHLKDRVWLFREHGKHGFGTVKEIASNTLYRAIEKLVTTHSLTDANGRPLRISVSRLRITFANRMFELLDGDLGLTAVALGNTPQVAGRHYMSPGEEAQRNWKFLGEVLTQELLTSTLGATERTPAGHCTDPTDGQYAPKKKDGTTCFAFLNCVRCRNYAVTGEDLYRLFSFYWRVLKERERMDARIWDKHYAHIPRLIERDVIQEGIRKKVFSATDVDTARERARFDPHPFWGLDSLSNLEMFRENKDDGA